MPAARVRVYAGEEIWQSYFKFSFERNPWDRQVSWFHYKTKSKPAERKQGFEAFNRDRRRAFVHNWSLYAEEGAPMIDYVGRYETLEADFGHVLDRLGLTGKVELPRANVSAGRKGSYRDYYDDRQRALVADWYAPEIAYFGYEF